MRCRRCNPVPEEVRRAAGLLERRWTLSILYASIEGAERFNEFLDALGGIPPGTLASRLSELEQEGVDPKGLLEEIYARARETKQVAWWLFDAFLDRLRAPAQGVVRGR